MFIDLQTSTVTQVVIDRTATQDRQGVIVVNGLCVRTYGMVNAHMAAGRSKSSVQLTQQRLRSVALSDFGQD